MITEHELVNLVRQLTPEVTNPARGTIAGWFDDPEYKRFRRPRQRLPHSDLTALTSWFNRTPLPRLRRLWRLEGHPTGRWNAESIMRYLHVEGARTYGRVAGRRVILVARHTRNEESIRISAADLQYQLGTPVSFMRGEGIVDNCNLLVWYDLDCCELPLPPLPNLLAVTERFARKYIESAAGEAIRSDRAYARYDQQMCEWNCPSLPRQDFEAAVQTIFPQTAVAGRDTLNGVRWKAPFDRMEY